MSDSIPDPRHYPLTQFIGTCYKQATGLPVPWSPKTAKLMQNFLRGCSWPLDKLKDCVQARFDSEGANPCQDPAEWIFRIPNFAAGPLDRYGKPIYKQKPQENWREGFESAADYFSKERVQ